MNIVAFKGALFAYLLATGFYLLYIIFIKDRFAKIGKLFTIIGFSAHTLAIIIRYFEAGYPPFTNLHESLSIFAWVTILFYLFYEYKYNMPSLGSFILPLSFMLLVYAAIVPMGIEPLRPALQSIWLSIHTAFAFLGYGAFALAFCVAIMYIIQERQLKRKKIGPFYYRLPALDVLDYIEHKSLAIGFPCLTIAIITGSMWASKAWGAYWSWDPKETWSLITWFIYTAIIHSRIGLGWRGKKASYLAIIGFIFVLFTFLGVNLLLKGLHSYV